MKLTSFLALALVGLAAALPAIDSDTFANNVLVSTIASSDVAVPIFSVPAGAAIITPNSPFHALNPGVADSVVTCPSSSCVGTCYAFALSGLSKNVCYSPSSAFYAAYLYIGSGTVYPFSGYASTTTAKCGNAFRLSTNACGTFPSDAFDFFLH